MALDTIAVTGGNGKIGEAILAHLNDHGYRTVNVARGKRREEVSDEYRTTDLLDAGEVYGSLGISDADAVIHMGTIPAPTSNPGFETYRSNAMSTYHVLEAAQNLGIESVCIASSVNVMGSVYQDAPMDVRYLPMDEEHPPTPRDPYALGKHSAEVTADGFGRREGPPYTISSLRYPWVATSDELREAYAESDRGLDALREAPRGPNADELFTYLHLDDGAAVARKAVEADFEGHERFWTVAADTTADVETATLVDEFYADVDVRTSFEGTEGLVDVSKAADLLDWQPTRSWRDLSAAVSHSH
jgi:nucleoside-diphosphate-sugar epimerase